MFALILFLFVSGYRNEKHNLLLAAKVLNIKAVISPFLISYSLVGDYRGRKMEIRKYAILYNVLVFTRPLKKPKIKFLEFGSPSYPTPHTHYFGGKVFYAFNRLVPYFRWRRSRLTETEIIDIFEELNEAAQILESRVG